MFSVRRLVLLPLLALALHAQSTTPTLTQALPAQTFLPGAAATTLDLRSYFGLPGVSGQVAQVDTVLGKFNVELFASDAPKTVENFMAYIAAGRWSNSIVHRSIPGFVIQMGGYTAATPPVAIAKFAPVQNEYKRSSLRGTLAMAKIGPAPGQVPTDATINSATSEWFVNLGNNSANLDNQNGGFTVFARVIGSGMTVVDAIAAVPVYNGGTGTAFENVPLRDIQTGQSNIEISNLIVVRSVAITPIYPASTGSTSVLSFSVTSSNPAVATAALSGSSLTLTPVANGSASITVTATDTNGNAITGTIAVTVGGPVAAAITAQPTPQIRMISGTSNTVVFNVTATGTPAPTYQWKRNGVNVTGKTTATYVLTNASDAQAGTFTCVVTNVVGPAEESRPSVLSFIVASGPSRLANLSILTDLASGESMTMGTIIGGPGTSSTATKPLLARAAGPALTQFGLGGVLADPKMTLNFTTPTPAVVIDNNNDWGGSATLASAFGAVGAFAYATSGSKDAAIFRPALAPGKYTVEVGDVGSASGTVIAELYDSTPDAAFTSSTPRLMNVSALKQIAFGSSLTVGFNIGGTTAKTVLVRAMGPTLSVFGVAGTMADPQLALYSGSAKIAENDNWGGDLQLSSAGDSVGAFSPSNAGSRDAILLVTLAPGSYTAQVSGVGSGGLALVEVYEVP
ncbi:MAG: peptidylprolyl isomerase [Verrucomicrobia bacterium]|nr:peptidylprolyl isomerase [Verrucomicrobiota bacterium]